MHKVYLHGTCVFLGRDFSIEKKGYHKYCAEMYLWIFIHALTYLRDESLIGQVNTPTLLFISVCKSVCVESAS